MAQGFAAVLLVCLAPLPSEVCTEATAVEVRSIVVENEMGCLSGWQELVARAGDRDRGDSAAYLKTVCRRVEPRG